MCQNWFIAQIQLHLIQYILRHFRTASKPKLNFILLKLLWSISKLCLGRNSIASYRQISRTTPICVSAKIHLNLLEKFLRHFQKVLQPKLKCIWLKLFQVGSKLCLSWISIATYRKYPRTIRNCNWADFQLHLIEHVVRISQIGSEPNFKCIWLNLIQDLSQMFHNWNSIKFHRSSSEIFQFCVSSNSIGSFW